MNDDLKQIIDTIKDRVDIVQVINEYVKLDRNNKALCPFHDEKTPSFSVNPKGQYFYCFGCGVGGDVFKFLMLIQNKTFLEVLRDLAQKTGVDISNISGADTNLIEEKNKIENVLSLTAKYYHKNLTKEAKDYLISKRGFTVDSISRFQIGFANGGLKDYLLNECGLGLELCLKSGLLKRTENGRILDYFYNRIIFPIFYRGKVVNLCGRAFDNSHTKYLNLPGEIHHLYNEEALFNDEVVLTEGITDCIATNQVGFPAVGLLGACGFKKEFADKFSNCKRIYVCFDADPAGRQGAQKAVEALGDKARIIELPEKLDLNDYFKDRSPSDFKALKNSAKDYLEYLIAEIPQNIEKTDLSEYLKPILNLIAKCDPAKAETYLSRIIKDRFGLINTDIIAYRKMIKDLRDESTESKKKKSETEAKPKYIARFDNLVDIVSHEGQPAFLIKQDDEIEIVSEIEIDGQINFPPPANKIPWLLPRGDQVKKMYRLEQQLQPSERDGAIFDDLVEFLKSVSELPESCYYDFLAAWVLHTYLTETIQYTPIICLFAVPERGKTRTGKGLIYLAYRGIHVESLRDPYIIRIAEHFGSTMFFDVKNIWRKAEKSGSEDILLLRFEKGATVPRVNNPDRGAFQDTDYYSIFGPTIIGTNENMDKILETRSITINMPEANRRFENEITPQLALPLKERLLAYRARHLGNPLPSLPKPATGRLGDILKPIMQIIRLVSPQNIKTFEKMVADLQSSRLMIKAESLEAEILGAIIQLEDQVIKGGLAIKTITDHINQGRTERTSLTPHRIGHRLSAMGFEKCKTGVGNTAILWSDDKIEKLKTSYGLNQSPETPETQETPEENTGESGDSGDSAVKQEVLL
jgi:DNA primase catalytic core